MRTMHLQKIRQAVWYALEAHQEVSPRRSALANLIGLAVARKFSISRNGDNFTMPDVFPVAAARRMASRNGARTTMLWTTDTK